MGLQADIQSGAARAFSAIADLLTAVTYRHITPGTYDPAAGTQTPTVTTQSVSVLLLDYSAREIDRQAIQPGDQKVLCPQSYLSPAPTLLDEMVVGTDTWAVVRVEKDPAGATWELQVRRA